MTFSIFNLVKEQNSFPCITVLRLEFGPVVQMKEYLCVCLQVFSYLVACDHLCRLGYHMAQVEEALEMFQNCETKVRATFLLFKISPLMSNYWTKKNVSVFLVSLNLLNGF